MSVAGQHLVDSIVALLVVPILISEFAECPWRDSCRPVLEAGSGDVSLLPRVGWREWKIHRDHGVHDRSSLAELDVPTGELVGAGVDLATPLAAILRLDPATPLAQIDILRKRPKQLSNLTAASVLTVGDLTALDAKTASYAGSGLSSLPEQIDQARAALGLLPVYRRRGVGIVAVPRGDVEVEVDMENVEDGVYLWGRWSLIESAWGLSRRDTDRSSHGRPLAERPRTGPS